MWEKGLRGVGAVLRGGERTLPPRLPPPRPPGWRVLVDCPWLASLAW